MQGAWLGRVKLDGATLRRAALWRSGAPGASIDLTDFSELDPENAFTVQEFDRKTGEVRDILASLLRGASVMCANLMRGQVSSLRFVLMEASPEQEARLHGTWPIRLPMEPPSRTALATFLADLSCRSDDAHFIAARIVEQLAEPAMIAGRDIANQLSHSGTASQHRRTVRVPVALARSTVRVSQKSSPAPPCYPLRRSEGVLRMLDEITCLRCSSRRRSPGWSCCTSASPAGTPSRPGCPSGSGCGAAPTSSTACCGPPAAPPCGCRSW